MPAFDQGVQENRYKLIPRTLIFITRDNQLLLIKGANNKQLWANKYNGIGGHVERGENILSAAKRELHEESGLVSDDLWLCGVVTVDTGQNTGIGIFIFRGEATKGELKRSKEGSLEWIEKSKYSDLPLVEDLYDLIPKVMTMHKYAAPFFAHSKYDEQDNLVLTIIE